MALSSQAQKRSMVLRKLSKLGRDEGVRISCSVTCVESLKVSSDGSFDCNGSFDRSICLDAGGFARFVYDKDETRMEQAAWSLCNLELRVENGELERHERARALAH